MKLKQVSNNVKCSEVYQADKYSRLRRYSPSKENKKVCLHLQLVFKMKAMCCEAIKSFIKNTKGRVIVRLLMSCHFGASSS